VKKTTRNQLTSVAVLVVAGFFCAVLGNLAGDPSNLTLTVLPAVFGGFSYVFLSNLSGTRKDSKADAAARAGALSFVAPAGRALVYGRISHHAAHFHEIASNDHSATNERSPSRERSRARGSCHHGHGG
jgi:hypothetical protein